MGVFKRGLKLWFRIKAPSGEWVNRPSAFVVGQEKEAQAVFDLMLDQLAAGGEGDELVLGPATVKSYCARWLKERRDRGVGSVDDEEGRLKKWVLPELGNIELSALKPRQLQEFVRGLRTKKGRRGDDLAPRSIRHIWNDLKSMLKEAVADELLATSPAVLKKGDLPGKQDADPLWRSTAVFNRAEVEALISDDRLPEDRRVFYALAFITGMRTGEEVALTWRDYDAEAEPLGRIHVTKSYSRRQKKLKGTKTGAPRVVPVHPTLARVLAAWKLSGWERLMKKKPGPDDLVIPSRLGRFRSTGLTLKRLHEDLERLGLRARRMYDSRRTFISLGLSNGASKDILSWVTHVPGDQVDEYTTIAWEALCGAVSQLKISLVEGRVLVLPKAAVGAEGAVTSPVTVAVTDAVRQSERPGILADSGPSLFGVYGTRSRTKSGVKEAGTPLNAGLGLVYESDMQPSTGQHGPDCNECNEALEAVSRAHEGDSLAEARAALARFLAHFSRR